MGALARAGEVRGKTEVTEDAADHEGILNSSYQAEGAAAPSAGEDVHLEDPSEEVCPPHPPRRGGRACAVGSGLSPGGWRDG